jgi:hypothetical protein
MTTERSFRIATCGAAAALLAWTLGAPAQSSPGALPDWSGAWTRSTGAFYESTPQQALEPPPPADSPRRRPPYTPKFAAIYAQNLALIAADRFPDRSRSAARRPVGRGCWRCPMPTNS